MRVKVTWPEWRWSLAIVVFFALMTAASIPNYAGMHGDDFKRSFFGTLACWLLFFLWPLFRDRAKAFYPVLRPPTSRAALMNVRAAPLNGPNRPSGPRF